MKYDAFISYRHADLDLYIAKKVHKALETFKVPKAVAKKTGKKSIKRVFRDQEELPIGSDLGDNIESALSQSEYLLVICSPRTPESYWVQKEIDTFISMHGRDHVLAVLIEGEPGESFPPQLLIDDDGNPVEPLAADVRGVSKGEMNRKMKTEIMRLAAPLLGCSYDDLKQRHRERKMKRMAAMAAIVAVFALGFGAYNAYNAALIQQNYEGKQRNQSKYLADTSLNLLEDGDRRAAVLVALEALPSEENARPYVAEAQYALSEALYVYDMGNQLQMDRALHHDLPVSDFYFNLEGTQLVSIDQGNTVYVWDATDGKELARVSPRISEDGYIVRVEGASLYEDHIVICEDTAVRSITFDGQEAWNIKKEEEGISYCEFDETAGIVACISRREVTFYDMKTGEEKGRMENTLEYSYAGSMAFNDNHTKFAVSHINTDTEKGYASVYDFETGKTATVETKASFISDIAFTSDDGLVMTQTAFSEGIGDGKLVGTEYIQKVDCNTGEVLWQDSFPYQTIGPNAVSSQIKTRCYQDEQTKELHDEVIVSSDNKAYCWDNLTGEKLSEVAADGGIISLLISTTSGYGYLAQNNGTVAIVDMTTGFQPGNTLIEIEKSINEVFIRNGIFAFRTYASPSLTLMKYPMEAKVTEVDTLDNTILEVDVSKGESYYAVVLYDSETASRVRFYRTKDNQFVGEWVEEEYYRIESGFTDDKTYTIISGDGKIMYYDVETGKKKIVSVIEDSYNIEYDINEEWTMAIAVSGYQAMVIDLQNRRIMPAVETEHYLYGAVITEDGEWAYCNAEDKGACLLDVSSGKMTELGLTREHILNGFSVQESFAVSHDGKLLAVICSDGMLRVYEQEELVAEIPFTGVNRRFVRFSEDNTQIMMQGDDYYFKVYDLKEKCFCYMATNQYNEIWDVMFDEESQTISLITGADMLILNAEDYERIAQIDGGAAYLPQSRVIYSSSYKTLYQFPYMTLEMLRQEAKEQFPGEELSELEKIRFHVE